MRHAFYHVLAQTTTEARPGPEDPQALTKLTGAVAAMGLCVLVVWIIRRALHPRKLRLADTPGRANRLTPLHLAIPFAVWLGFGAVVGATLPRPMHLPGIAAVQVLWSAVSLLIAARAFQGGLSRGLGLSLRRWIVDAGRALLGYLSLMPALLAVFLLTTLVTPEEMQQEHQLLRLLREQGPAVRVLAVVSAVVLAPISEELFFRGLLQSYVRRETQSPWAAVLITAAMFGLVHAPYWHTVPAIALLGVVLGYNYERCGRLLPSILIHAMFNGVMVADVLVYGGG
jgi:membrane protease YdiL (CAAX protease family)